MPLPESVGRGETDADQLASRCQELSEKCDRLVGRIEKLVAVESGIHSLTWWALRHATSGLALVVGGAIHLTNTRFLELERTLYEHGAKEVYYLRRRGQVQTECFATLRSLVVQEAARCVVEGQPSFRERYETAGGDQLLEISFEQASGPDSQPMVVAVANDVTDRVRTERKLAAAHDALEQQQRMRALGELASGISHDLNNTLNAIRLRLELVRADRALAKGHAANVDALSRIVSEATAMVGRLQDFARQRQDRPIETVDLRQVMTQAIDMTRTELEQKTALGGPRIRIAAELPELPLVRASVTELRHVFVNLFLNARDAMAAGGTIWVSGYQTDGGVVVQIEDEGKGIPEANLGRIFDPFFSTKGRRGTGLGLSMAYGVMTRLGGTISAANRKGGGAVFTLRFPPLGEDREASEERVGVGRGETRRLLVIDDDRDNLDATEQLLELGGHMVDTAESGPAALARFRAGARYDLVLCDIGMPDMNGWQVAEEIHRVAPETVVYMLSGWAREVADDDPRRQKVAGVLEKPIDLDRLRHILRHAPATAPMAR